MKKNTEHEKQEDESIAILHEQLAEYWKARHLRFASNTTGDNMQIRVVESTVTCETTETFCTRCGHVCNRNTDCT